jgi:hypothetical protein
LVTSVFPNGLIPESWDEFRSKSSGNVSRLAEWITDCVREGYLDRDGSEVKRALELDPLMRELATYRWK